MSSTKRVRFAADKEIGFSNVKRSRFEDGDECRDAAENNDEDDVKEGTSETKKKHTLDSDEEDETDKYELLDMEKVEGQEEATLEYEGKIKIMPFNMKDDLEEGHFDSDGTFIYDKKETLIRDAWLDNVEWDKVKDVAGKNWGKTEDDVEKEEEDEPEKNEEGKLKSVYTRLLEVLQSKETIAGLLKKLNNEKGANAAEERKRRWAAKKAGTNLEEDPRNKKVAELTILADSLVSLGHMEAYQLGPEKIKELLAEMEPTKIEGLGAKEATMDMFAE